MDAVDDLSDAIDVTRNLLLPIRGWLWLKLAVVVFFLGGSSGFSGNVPTDPSMVPGEQGGDPAPGTVAETLPEDFWLWVGIIGAVVLAVVLVFELIAAIMEFVFIESLRSKEVSILRYAADNIGRALRLFAFRVGVGLLVLLLIGAPAAYIVLTASSVDAMLAPIVALILVALVVGLLVAVVLRFTAEFVAPIMLLESRGVIGAWKRFWATFKANWTEYVVYLVLVWVLQLVVGFAVGILGILALLVVAIPFGIVAFLLASLGEIGIVLAVLVAIVALLVFLLVSALISVPIQSYFRYYALLLLGDTNAELDLIPDQRAAVREPDVGDEGGFDGGSGGGFDDGSGGGFDGDDVDTGGDSDTGDDWSGDSAWDDGDDEDRGW